MKLKRATLFLLVFLSLFALSYLIPHEGDKTTDSVKSQPSVIVELSPFETQEVNLPAWLKLVHYSPMEIIIVIIGAITAITVVYRIVETKRDKNI
jgi:hypothetical protein